VNIVKESSMKREQISAVLLAGVAAVTLGLSSLSVAEEKPSMPIKQIMGENFAGLQNILVGLITAHYEAVPEQVAIIHQHATDLTQAVPDSAKDDRDRFLGYAYNLRGHSADLKAIVEELMVHDAAVEQKGVMVPDQLREAAAAHYGSMVTMCVACHNRFRLTVVGQ
jgi:cytochrome c556